MYRISALEIAPKHPLVGRVHAQLPVEQRLEEGLRLSLVHLAFGVSSSNNRAVPLCAIQSSWRGSGRPGSSLEAVGSVLLHGVAELCLELLPLGVLPR